MTRLRLPRWDTDVKRFFAALGPAVTGSAGLQLALFADTIIASFLPYGALSALYYADRLYQLPIGVIGIAAGTVVLPEMARRLAAGDERGAQEAQNRTIEFILALAIPCMVAFLFIPDLIMRALFARGAFTSADAAAAGATLAAYTTGLIPFVLIRSATATFFARGDTATPVKAALAAAALNIFLKFLLMTPLAQVGLALATAIGAWVNFILVMWLALRAGLIRVDARLKDAIWKLAVAGLVLALVLWFGAPYADKLLNVAALRDEIALVILAAVGGVVYGGALLALFGWHRVKTFSPKRDASSVLAAED
jgi:putative peptidoglycan lipid II flippase